MQFLSRIEHVFRTSAPGWIVAPGIPRKGKTVPAVKIKDKLQLRTPDGHIRDTHVAALELVSGPHARDCTPIRLPDDVTEQDIPIGTEIWHSD